MLAQNFKTAADLGISDVEQDALVKVLGMLERGEITHRHFDMASVWSDCGTVGCLLGWAKFVSRDENMFERCFVDEATDSLTDLFLFVPSNGSSAVASMNRMRSSITPSDAAVALRSYLTTGEANWAEALT